VDGNQADGNQAGASTGPGVRTRWVAVAVAVLVLVGAAAVWQVRGGDDSGGTASTSPSSTAGTPPSSTTGTSGVSTTAPAASGDALAVAARTRVFFGHQSVGGNIVEAIPAAFAAAGREPVAVVETDGPAGGAWFGQADIGENTQPQTKIDEFGRLLRGGLADRVDVAFMKFCYVDVDANTDVDALFTAYRTAAAALEQEFPEVRFLHVTVPLTTISDADGLADGSRPALSRGNGEVLDNAARQELNALIRSTYPAAQVFDLAAVESTAPDGTRVVGTLAGAEVYALYEGYSDDGGHLNAEGARRAATAMFEAIAAVQR
jgi:hypothetical protein